MAGSTPEDQHFNTDVGLELPCSWVSHLRISTSTLMYGWSYLVAGSTPEDQQFNTDVGLELPGSWVHT